MKYKVLSVRQPYASLKVIERGQSFDCPLFISCAYIILYKVLLYFFRNGAVEKTGIG